MRVRPSGVCRSVARFPRLSTPIVELYNGSLAQRMCATLIPMNATRPPDSQPAVPRFPAELIDSTPFLLKRLGFAVKEQAMEAYERFGLNPTHHAVLAVLDEGTRETQGAIADALGYDRGQLVGLLDE